jgi:hypothetical protein
MNENIIKKGVERKICKKSELYLYKLIKETKRKEREREKTRE